MQHGGAVSVTAGGVIQGRIGYGVADMVEAMSLILTGDFGDAGGAVLLSASDGNPHRPLRIAATGPVTVPPSTVSAKLTMFLAMLNGDAANRATLTLSDAWLGSRQ